MTQKLTLTKALDTFLETLDKDVFRDTSLLREYPVELQYDLVRLVQIATNLHRESWTGDNREAKYIPTRYVILHHRLAESFDREVLGNEDSRKEEHDVPSSTENSRSTNPRRIQ